MTEEWATAARKSRDLTEEPRMNTFPSSKGLEVEFRGTVGLGPPLSQAGGLRAGVEEGGMASVFRLAPDYDHGGSLPGKSQAARSAWFLQEAIDL